VAYYVLREFGARRPGLTAAGTAVAVAASFLLMLYLATVNLVATVAFVLLAAGAVAYLVLRPDLGARKGALAATGIALTVAASFLFVLYLAVIAFIAAIGVYVLLRSRVKIKSAIILAGTALSGLLAAAALAFYVSLTYAM
jgi:hypothetical protein